MGQCTLADVFSLDGKVAKENEKKNENRVGICTVTLIRVFAVKRSTR